MKPRFPHSPSVPAPGTFALRSGNHVPTRTSTVHQPTAMRSLGAAWPPHLLLALRTTRAPHAGCRALALTAPTTQLAVAPQVRAPLVLPAPDSGSHGPGGCTPSLRWPREPPAHTPESSPASSGALSPPPALFVAANSCPGGRPPHPARLLAAHRVPCRALD